MLVFYKKKINFLITFDVFLVKLLNVNKKLEICTYFTRKKKTKAKLHSSKLFFLGGPVQTVQFLLVE